uniref:F-box domain-containing protein n=1 Tax=Nelumbo nucifera TaxID=4432 RepID=A0A822YSC2_NELNU|nr:TPA_asm: hypothetical protein HUJ06_004969 [Nelumbo nucifera]
MTLNFSHRPIFPATTPSEDNLLSSVRIANGYVVEGIPEKSADSFAKPWRFNWEFENSYDYTRDRADRGGSCEPISNDILDLLPSDPFGMEISATFTAITGWIEDFEADSDNYGGDEAWARKGDYQLVAGLNFIWNQAMKFHMEPGNAWIDERSNPCGEFGGTLYEKESEDGSCDGGFVSVCNMDEFLSFGDDAWPASHQAKESTEGTDSCSDGAGGAPHEALLYALSYLGVRDLLSAGSVCRMLRSAVESDSFLWRNIHIDQPLSERITDDVLLQLTNRAQGNLQCLSLVECPRITDDGLKRVLGSNPRLTKVCCTNILIFCTKSIIFLILSSLNLVCSVFI